ncbi:MAG: SMC-Scp complex subunit ScpB [Chloroflexi bacterium]|nr:SMC-Scp complex subunit ScpB [Chloroflexota bacterium]
MTDADRTNGQGPRGAEEPAASPETVAGDLTEAALEALLFVAERPLTRREIAALAGVDRGTVDARLGDLEVALRDRGIRLVTSADRVELATAPQAGALVARYVGVDAVRLSPAALETLAIVAYRQPVSRARVGAVRGVNVDAVMRTLTSRGLVEEAGHDPESGAVLYRTSQYFLQRIGLRSLDELPALAPFLPEVEALDEIGVGGGL